MQWCGRTGLLPALGAIICGLTVSACGTLTTATATPTLPPWKQPAFRWPRTLLNQPGTGNARGTQVETPPRFLLYWRARCRRVPYSRRRFDLDIRTVATGRLLMPDGHPGSHTVAVRPGATVATRGHATIAYSGGYVVASVRSPCRWTIRIDTPPALRGRDTPVRGTSTGSGIP